MGPKNKVIHTSTSSEDSKTILTLARMLKEKERDKLSMETIFHLPETLTIIKMILTKYEKDENDIYIISNYLKHLKSFMQSVTQGQPDDFDMTPLLKKISYDLQCEEHLKNSFVMRVGDIGKNFYVILSGSVSVLVPQVFQISMTKKQYFEHLIMLHKYKEKQLLERTYYNNVGVYPDIKLEQIEENEKKLLKKKKLKEKKRKEREKKIQLRKESLLKNPHEKESILLLYPEEEELSEDEDEEKNEFEKIKNFTLEKYIKEINAEDLYKEKFDSNEVKIVGYYKVTDLNQGSAFGEYALINDNQQRTASIFVKENSIFGTLSSQSYKISLKSIQENNKKKDIEFVFNTKIFNQISIFVFSQNYWNYFIHRKIFLGDYLFTQNQERNEIYFIQEGEFKITAYQVTHKKINLIISQLGNFKFEKIDYADIGTGIDIPLTYAKKGDILGMEDLLYDNKFFCSAVCISKKASFFSLDMNIFEKICKLYPKVLDNWKRIEIDKKILMIQKFQGVKYSNKNSLSGEFRKDDENAVFWKSSVQNNEDYKQYYLNNEKKYSKLERYNTIVNSFDKSLLNNRNTVVEKKLDSYTINKIKLQLLKEQNKTLPPINQLSENNSSNLISINVNSDNFNIKNSRINHNKNPRMYKPKTDLSLNELHKSVLSNNEDLISKMLLGKEVKEYKIKNLKDRYYFVNTENENEDEIKNKEEELFNKRKKTTKLISNNYPNALRRSAILKNLKGLERYKKNHMMIRNSLNIDKNIDF